jgi:HPt (histidine-containing phosphotransfer) domain-containing protein
MSEVFDKQALLDRVDGDLVFLKEMVDMLHNDCPVFLDQIREAGVSGDTDTLTEVAHTLKSMVANFCATSTEAAARSVEMMGREKQLVGIESAIEDLEMETKRLREALNTFMQVNRP